MNTKKELLRKKTYRKMLFIYLKQGIFSMKGSVRNRTVLAAFLFLMAWIYVLIFFFYIPSSMFEKMYRALYLIAYLFLFSLGFCACLFRIGAPCGYMEYLDDFQRIGFLNSAGESPVLLSSANVTLNGKILKELTFESCGIPLSEWEKEKEKLSSGLNLHIISINHGINNRQIKLQVISANHQIPDRIKWHQSLLRSKEFEILLGESVVGEVSVDLNNVPHILIGGSTGSGKTILLRSILLQCIAKNADVIVADFKGIDFHRVWSDYCEIITEAETFSAKLDTVISKISLRKKLFAEYDCADIQEYNTTSTGDRLTRIIIACDEVSELLDKTGLKKEAKEQLSRIESSLSTIARQGRAFGIHLVLATQRPDANILSGQIKNNVDCRICGRADNVLSQIILDNTDAADLIPKNATGRFLMYDGTIFQGYYVDDGMIADLRYYTSP